MFASKLFLFLEIIKVEVNKLVTNILDYQITGNMNEKVEAKAFSQDEVMCRFSFQYRSMDKNLMVHIEASSLNDAMVKFATHYHLIDKVYEIAKVS